MTDATTPAWQAALAAFKAATHECEWPGCRTLVLHQRHCAKHRPQGDWQIAAEVRDEERGDQASTDTNAPGG